MSSWVTPRAGLAAVVVGAPLTGVFVWKDKPVMDNGLTASLIVLTCFLAAVLLLLEFGSKDNTNPRRREYGFLEVTLGADGRFSTSKAVAAVWTLIFVAALVLLSAMVWNGALSVDQAFAGDWDPYFLLLGGPFAAAVLAKGITSSKAAGEADKTVTDAASSPGVEVPGSPSLADITCNDQGELSLADTQYWIFSLVAALYFAGAFISQLSDYANGSTATLTLPAIPSALLGLTSLSALTYVGAKQVATEGMRLVKIDPLAVTAGGDLKVSVINVPATVVQGNVTIRCQPSPGAAIDLAPSDMKSVGPVTTFTVAAPLAGTYTLTVITPLGVSAPGRFTVT